MIGGAVLIVGLLLILAGLAAARIPGGASFASSGITCPGEARGRGLSPRPTGPQPVRAFLLSPIHPATWYANAAIAIGLLRRHRARSPSSRSLASAGLATLLAGVGRRPHRARRSRARASSRGSSAGGSPSASSSGLRRTRTDRFAAASSAILRAEFADENRWRDVLYVAVNFPLAIIEFAVVARQLWTLALVAADHAHLVRRGRRRAVAGLPRPAGRARRPTVVAADAAGARAAAGRRVAVAARHGPPSGASSRGCCAPPRVASCAARSRRSRRAGRRSSTSRRASCTGSSATSTTAPSSAWSC